jgi:purine-nucleoside phosphorylase
MSYAYTPALRKLAAETAARLGIELRRGVYMAVTGPSFETPAEIRAFRTLGADAVGMSTVPEVISAAHCGMKVLAFSLITNMAAGVLDQPLSEEEVIEAGNRKGAMLRTLIAEILAVLPAV